MSAVEVAAFVDRLGMGAAYGALFRARGIDGHLLLQATEQDLEELGMDLRLHRVKLLEEIQHAQQRDSADASATR